MKQNQRQLISHLLAIRFFMDLAQISGQEEVQAYQCLTNSKLTFILCHHLKHSKRSLHVSETIRSVVSLSACTGFKTVHVFDEFQDLLENIISLHDNLYILGYFNLHLDKSNGNTNKFNEILTCFDLKQHVNFPTHVHGHWLDLLITKRISNSIKSVFPAVGFSDHLAVISEIDCCKTKWNKKNSQLYFRQTSSCKYKDSRKPPTP